MIKKSEQEKMEKIKKLQKDWEGMKSSMDSVLKNNIEQLDHKKGANEN